jgi:hypothetical protein
MAIQKKSHTKKIFLLTSFFLILFLSTVFIGTSQEKKPEIVEKVKMKPDLKVHSVFVERTGFTSTKAHRVRVTANVINASRFRTCDGPLKVKVEKKDMSRRRKTLYSRLGEAGVVELCADPTSGKLRTVSRVFDDIIPFGKTRKYKVTVDSMDQVSESSETNNILYSDPYEALSECDGVDVKIQWVEIRRTSRGMFIEAHAKNVCDGSCRGDVIWHIDESEAVPGAAGISQGPLSTRVDPFQEFHTSGPALGVMSTDGRVNTYTVRIEVGAPCSQSDSCRISIGPSDSGPIRVDCH